MLVVVVSCTCKRAEAPRAAACTVWCVARPDRRARALRERTPRVAMRRHRSALVRAAVLAFVFVAIAVAVCSVLAEGASPPRKASSAPPSRPPAASTQGRRSPLSPPRGRGPPSNAAGSAAAAAASGAPAGNKAARAGTRGAPAPAGKATPPPAAQPSPSPSPSSSPGARSTTGTQRGTAAAPPAAGKLRAPQVTEKPTASTTPPPAASTKAPASSSTKPQGAAIPPAPKAAAGDAGDTGATRKHVAKPSAEERKAARDHLAGAVAQHRAQFQDMKEEFARRKDSMSQTERLEWRKRFNELRHRSQGRPSSLLPKGADGGLTKDLRDVVDEASRAVLADAAAAQGDHGTAFQPSHVLKFSIAAQDTECLYEDVESEGELLRGGFVVTSGTTDDNKVDVTLTSPSDDEVKVFRGRSEGNFEVEAAEAGTFTICIRNWKPVENTVTLAWLVGTDDDNVLLRQEVATDGTVEPIVVLVASLHEEIDLAMAEQAYIKERVDRNILSESRWRSPRAHVVGVVVCWCVGGGRGCADVFADDDAHASLMCVALTARACTPRAFADQQRKKAHTVASPCSRGWRWPRS